MPLITKSMMLGQHDSASVTFYHKRIGSTFRVRACKPHAASAIPIMAFLAFRSRVAAPAQLVQGGLKGEKKGEFHAGFVYFNSFHYCLVRSGQLILWLISKNRF